MSLEINWFDIELRGLCIINTHIMTCSCKFIYIVQTRRLVNIPLKTPEFGATINNQFVDGCF